MIIITFGKTKGNRREKERRERERRNEEKVDSRKSRIAWCLKLRSNPRFSFSLFFSLSRARAGARKCIKCPRTNTYPE